MYTFSYTYAIVVGELVMLNSNRKTCITQKLSIWVATFALPIRLNRLNLYRSARIDFLPVYHFPAPKIAPKRLPPKPTSNHYQFCSFSKKIHLHFEKNTLSAGRSKFYMFNIYIGDPKKLSKIGKGYFIYTHLITFSDNFSRFYLTFWDHQITFPDFT